MDMDTDPRSSGVSTLATQEPVKSNVLSPRRRKSERIASRGKEPVEGSESRQRLPSRGKRASLLIEIARNDELHQRVPSRGTHLSTPHSEVLSRLLRSTIQALCNGEER